MNKSNSNEACQLKNILFSGGRLFDPLVELDQEADLLIKNGVISTIGKVQDFSGEKVDCRGKLIVPGLLDMHVHLREPGQEDKETIVSGCRAAMAGGFTGVACMPNTHPPLDNRGQIEYVKKQAQGLLVDVYPIGAVSKGQEGIELTEMGDMIDAGAVGFSDDGLPIRNASMVRRALEYTSMFGHPVIDHCEDLSLSGGGVMNESKVSTLLGLKAIPSISEEIHVARDLLAAEYTGGPLHIAHVTSEGSIRMIKNAKKRGILVTAETCPHYLVLTDENVRSFDTNTKMKPPLRTERDQKALLKGLKDGTIDVIATDHAPHTIDDKETEFDAAAFGIVGLETAVGIILTHLVLKNKLSLAQMVNKMAHNPRKILGLQENKLREGELANLTLLDLNKEWTVDTSKFYSKSRNTPFQGWKLKGRSTGVYNQSQWFVNEEK
jgi:dihydroorotase